MPHQIMLKNGDILLFVTFNVSPGFQSYNNLIISKQHRRMQLDSDLYQDCQIIFHRDSQYSYANDIQILQERQRLGTNGNIQRTSHEMDQIMNIFKYQSPLLKPMPCQDQFSSICSLNTGKSFRVQKPFCIKRQKKIKKTSNSRFHNYQKHLNNALKKLIQFPEILDEEQLYHKVAYQIWNTFCMSQIKTKRILHFIFNQRNQHNINEPELKTYKLTPIYRTYDLPIIAKAKNYITQIAIQQLNQQQIFHYLNATKIKNKEGFKEYLVQFRNQLENGFLKRRINSDKMN